MNAPPPNGGGDEAARLTAYRTQAKTLLALHKACGNRATLWYWMNGLDLFLRIELIDALLFLHNDKEVRPRRDLYP